MARVGYGLLTGSSAITRVESVITIAVHNVRKALVNVSKVPDLPDFSWCLVCCCTDQLAGLFTSTFNKSPAQSGVPRCFQRSTIITEFVDGFQNIFEAD